MSENEELVKEWVARCWLNSSRPCDEQCMAFRGGWTDMNNRFGACILLKSLVALANKKHTCLADFAKADPLPKEEMQPPKVR